MGLFLSPQVCLADSLDKAVVAVLHISLLVGPIDDSVVRGVVRSVDNIIVRHVRKRSIPLLRLLCAELRVIFYSRLLEPFVFLLALHSTLL